MKIDREIRMFGDPVMIRLFMDGRNVTAVSCLRGNDRCRRLVEAVDKQIDAGVSVLDQQWKIVAVADLLAALLDEQDRVQISGAAA